MIDLNLCRRIMDAHPYPLLFATVSGVHLLPAREVLGLREPKETVSSEKIIEGVEIDLITHDAAKFFRLMLRRNGYVLEQLLSPLVVHTTPEHEELKALAAGCLTKHHAHHYLGFAHTQWNLFRKEDPPRVKPLLYVYRVLLTGIHLMRTGEVQANLLTLNETYKLPQSKASSPASSPAPNKARSTPPTWRSMRPSSVGCWRGSKPNATHRRCPTCRPPTTALTTC
jgi:uncharacterized protein